MKKLLLLVLLILIVLLVLFFLGGHKHENHSHGESYSEKQSHQDEELAQQQVEEVQSQLHTNHQTNDSATESVAGAAKLVEAKLKTHMSREDGLSNAELNISNGWVRGVIPGTNVTAAYLDFSSSKALNLYNFSSPDFERVELHDMKLSESGVMTMMKLDSLIVDESGVSFTPNGKHLMLINPTRNIKVGETVEVTLNAGGRLGGSITIQLPVVPGS